MLTFFSPVSRPLTVAIFVVLIIFLVGCLMRRRRARAFKSAFPLQQVNHAEQGQAHGYYGQQWNPQQQQQYQQQQGGGQPQYGQQYVGAGQPAFDAPPQCASVDFMPTRRQNR